ncbi:unnamed protein product [Arabidopsis halleri]
MNHWLMHFFPMNPMMESEIKGEIMVGERRTYTILHTSC